jgi:hypothetical protein
MNKQTFILYILIIVMISCGSEKLEESQVEQLLKQANAYPLLVEHRLFCNDTETAKRVHKKGLAELGLVTANLAHTLNDIGKPLISFTEKAKPYLLTTSDTLKSIDVQKVKIGEEQFHEVVQIQYSANRDRALVTYTTTVEDITPFARMLEKTMEGEQVRETSFTRTDRGWEWDKKIVKINRDRKGK